MSSIAPRVEIGFAQLSGVGEIFTHRDEAHGEGRPDDALALAATVERHRPLHPAAADALLQQHRGDGRRW